MKEVKAYVRDNMVDGLVDALQKIPDVPGVALVPVRGYGHAYDDDELAVVRMTKVEVDVPDDYVERVIECIVRHARTGRGHVGDGRIHVTPLDDAVRIADGERGAAALERGPPPRSGD